VDVAGDPLHPRGEARRIASRDRPEPPRGREQARAAAHGRQIITWSALGAPGASSNGANAASALRAANGGHAGPHPSG